MFKPLALYIGLRYTRAKRRNHFISFISFSSMIGIALGVAVLITVLSVMNGFDEEIHEQVFGVVQHVTIRSLNGSIKEWPSVADRVRNYPGVLAVAPFVSGQGLLKNRGQVQSAFLVGIDPNAEATVSELPNKMVEGSLMDLKPGEFGIVLGVDLVRNLGLMKGDKVTVMIPQVTVTPVGVMPRLQRFTLVGTFSVGSGFRFDSTLAFLNLKDAQTLLRMKSGVSGLRLKIQDLFAAPQMARDMTSFLPMNFMVSDWTSQFGAFFKAVKLEKTMMFFILLLIVAVAAFNLVSGLVMVVTDKQADIAILRTLGATPRTILGIFIVQGSVVGIFGTLLGVVGGIALASHVTQIVNFIQDIFHVQFISSNIYFIDYLPSKLEWRDVLHITLVALVMSLLATLYPAWRASRTQPAEALRYE